MRSLALTLPFVFVLPLAAQKVDYEKDVAYAIDAIGKQCKTLLKSKRIDWKKVTAPLRKQAKQTETPAEHLLLLWRLLARLQDGHAAVQPLDAGKGVQLDLPRRDCGPGLFLCRIGDGVFVKNAWGPAKAAGIEPGQEVLEIDGVDANEWLATRTAELTDLLSFSTAQQADFYARHWGLADVAGTRVEFTVRGGSKKGAAKKKRKVGYERLNQTAQGPAFWPAGSKRHDNVYYGVTEGGFGYVHVRRCKGTLPEEIDVALAALGDVRGMILDFRGNSGGGFDHRALFGRFLPAGTKWQVGSGYDSQGEHPFGGPLVVIMDATCRSAGETGVGQFTEDGRAYGIGESPTAGMSASKTTIELPSKLFALYVAVASNKARFQDGKGIEGVGVIPHELVEFDPADLAAERDTLIRRADQLLASWPDGPEWKQVKYDPREHGFAATDR